MTKKRKKSTSKKKGDKMEIRVSEIKQELSNLNNSIDDYELTYLNLYNILNNMSSSWEDHYANLFFTDVEKEKLKVKNTVDEIKKISEVYKYIADRYSRLGNKVKFDLNNKINVLNKVENCLSQLNNIISSYEGLDLSDISSSIKNAISNELSDLKSNKTRLEKYKTKLKEVIEYIEETEKNINLKISRVRIEIIKEQNIKEFLGDDKWL